MKNGVGKSVHNQVCSLRQDSEKHSHSNSRITSRHSSLSSTNRQDVAANEATLEVLLVQGRLIEECQKLEAEASYLGKYGQKKRR